MISGVETYAYLKDVLERLPTATNHQLAELTPSNWSRQGQNPPARLAA